MPKGLRILIVLCLAALMTDGCCSSQGDEGDAEEEEENSGTFSAGSDEFGDEDFSEARWGFESSGDVNYSISGGALTVDLTGVPPREDGGPQFLMGKSFTGDCDVEVFVSESNHDEAGEAILFAIIAGPAPEPPYGGGVVGFGGLPDGTSGYALVDGETGPLEIVPYPLSSIHLRMKREGTSFTSMVSEDGVNWTTLSPVQEAPSNESATLVLIAFSGNGANRDYRVSLDYVRFRCGGVATEGDPLSLISCE